MNNYKCCPGVSNDESEPYLMCRNCNVRVHANCLRLAKQKMRLLGDIFFKYLCEECSNTGEDELIRDKLSWFAVIVLTLYNLDKRSQGLSKNGFFHWKMHISSFIDKHWDYLFGYSVKRKKNWHGTISSILSHFSPTYLISGTDKLRESGWWKLALPLTPQMILEHYNTKTKEKKKADSQKKSSELKHVPSVQSHVPSCASTSSTSSSNKDSDISTFDDTSNMEMNSFESSLPWNWALLPDSSDPLSQPQYLTPSNETSLDSLLFERQEDMDIDIDVDVESSDDPLAFRSSDSLDVTGMLNETIVCKTYPKDDYLEVKHEEIVHLNVNDVSTEESDMDEDDEEYLDLTPIPSLFKARDKNKIEPWMKTEKTRRNIDTRCIPMSEYEEVQLLMQLRKVPNMSDAPGAVRRLYRKLCVRKIKRERNMPLFNLDMKNEFCIPSTTNRNEEQKRVLDRFQHSPSRLTSAVAHRGTTFFSRLMGSNKPTSFYSPYTRRLLKPFIRRDTETIPLWLQLMQEMLTKVHKNDINWKLPPRAPIDYSYVRPDHIPTINSLAREFFYPGIDLTECLQYPDFSCVVLYKKLIVGFAFMVPDVGYNEAYISFLLTRPEWRKAGIATFMLYHLIQTCMGRDVTLHVSATNPAVILYQKFGFKVEEFVQNFYDKYFPADSRECRHAFFLRLSR